MPTDPASRSLRHSIQRCKKEVFNALGIYMNFATVILRKALDKFRNRAFSSVIPVKEWGNDHKSQFTASSRQPRFRLIPNSWSANRGGTEENTNGQPPVNIHSVVLKVGQTIIIVLTMSRRCTVIVRRNAQESSWWRRLTTLLLTLAVFPLGTYQQTSSPRSMFSTAKPCITRRWSATDSKTAGPVRIRSRLRLISPVKSPLL